MNNTNNDAQNKLMETAASAFVAGARLAAGANESRINEWQAFTDAVSYVATVEQLNAATDAIKAIITTRKIRAEFGKTAAELRKAAHLRANAYKNRVKRAIEEGVKFAGRSTSEVSRDVNEAKEARDKKATKEEAAKRGAVHVPAELAEAFLGAVTRAGENTDALLVYLERFSVSDALPEVPEATAKAA